ncbi:hypothetical protein ES703_95666 [subsurface metagenome]
MRQVVAQDVTVYLVEGSDLFLPEEGEEVEQVGLIVAYGVGGGVAFDFEVVDVSIKDFLHVRFFSPPPGFSSHPIPALKGCNPFKPLSLAPPQGLSSCPILALQGCNLYRLLFLSPHLVSVRVIVPPCPPLEALPLEFLGLRASLPHHILALGFLCPRLWLLSSPFSSPFSFRLHHCRGSLNRLGRSFV